MLLIVPVDNYTRKGGKGRGRERLGEVGRVVNRNGSLASHTIVGQFYSQAEWATRFAVSMNGKLRSHCSSIKITSTDLH